MFWLLEHRIFLSTYLLKNLINLFLVFYLTQTSKMDENVYSYSHLKTYIRRTIDYKILFQKSWKINLLFYWILFSNCYFYSHNKKQKININKQ